MFVSESWQAGADLGPDTLPLVYSTHSVNENYTYCVLSPGGLITHSQQHFHIHTATGVHMALLCVIQRRVAQYVSSLN